MNIFKNIFTNRLSFQPVDPLAGGLGDEIVAEQREPQAIHLEEGDSSSLQRFWTEVEDDIHDGGGLSFSDE